VRRLVIARRTAARLPEPGGLNHSRSKKKHSCQGDRRLVSGSGLDADGKQTIHPKQPETVGNDGRRVDRPSRDPGRSARDAASDLAPRVGLAAEGYRAVDERRAIKTLHSPDLILAKGRGTLGSGYVDPAPGFQRTP